MQQFSLVPMNLLGASRVAAYADSGYWSRRAMAEAGKLAQVEVVARHPGELPLAAPAPGRWAMPADCAYCHITPNETVDGIAYPELPETGEVPLVADCTSSFLTAPVDVAKFGVIYASAQKNIGLAGLTVTIVREDLLERCRAELPAPFSYRRQAEEGSCVNTPPMLAIHIAGLVFDWIAGNGGLVAMAAASQRKAARLYAAIDGSAGFYRAPVAPGHRSPINIRFHLAETALTEVFLSEAEAAGLTNLRGHLQLGGIRASLYNAMPEAGVVALAGFMADFARRYG
jgi:phosphoserine aminotransferase